MNQVELFKTMFSEDDFNSLLNTNKELIKDLSTDEWKRSEKRPLRDSGHKSLSVKNKVENDLNFWHVQSSNDCMGWIYDFIGDEYNNLLELTEEVKINLDRFKKLTKILYEEKVV